jgi:flagellar biogenesis protein FliO
MNHRDTTIVMFFLIGGLILALIVLILLCGVLFIRVRSDTNHSSDQKQGKFRNIK